MKPRTDELLVLAAYSSPMQVHSAAQAAPLLGIDLNVVQSANPGDAEFIPYVPDPVEPRSRQFLLGDLLASAGMADAIPGNGDPVKREDAEAMLERRVGPPPPDWFDPAAYDSVDDLHNRALWDISRHAAQPVGAAPAPKVRGRPRKVQPMPGGRIETGRRFASTADFLRRAHLDDSWIFAKPLGGRPYDFLDSIMEMDSAPWEVMTLAAYLDAVRSGAADDHASDSAAQEAEIIANSINSAGR